VNLTRAIRCGLLGAALLLAPASARTAATVSNLTYEFLDNGVIHPTGKVPLVSTVNVYYPRIAYLQIHTMYTDRESMEYGGSNGFAS
jgi:hypothetical protein